MAAEKSRELVLVTGATGYIASCLVKQLAETGDYRLRCTVRSLENNQKLDALKQVLKDCKTQPEFVKVDLLQSSEDWKKVVEGCTYVLHVASPFPMGESEDPDSVIKPAVEGTLSILKACANLSGAKPKRVVVTSSCYAVYEYGREQEKIFTEADWPDFSKLPNAYAKSKPMAEKAAWDYVNSLPDERKFEFAVVHPGLVFGPPVISMSCTSVDIAKNIMTRAWPAVPATSMPVVDVRDVALAHIKAMKIPGAVGHRHILAAGTSWMKDVAQILADEFNPKGFNVSTTSATQEKEDFPKLDNTRMRTVLGIEPRPLKQSLVEMGEAMIKLGIVSKPDA